MCLVSNGSTALHWCFQVTMQQWFGSVKVCYKQSLLNNAFKSNHLIKHYGWLLVFSLEQYAKYLHA